MRTWTRLLSLLVFINFSCNEEDVKPSLNELAINYDWEISSLIILERYEPIFHGIVTDTDKIRFKDNGKYYKVIDSEQEILAEYGDWRIENDSTLIVGSETAKILSWTEQELVYSLNRAIPESGGVKLEVKRKGIKL